MPKIRMIVQFEKKQVEALKKIQEKTGAPIAELVRRAVNMYLEKQK